MRYETDQYHMTPELAMLLTLPMNSSVWIYLRLWKTIRLYLKHPELKAKLDKDSLLGLHQFWRRLYAGTPKRRGNHSERLAKLLGYKVVHYREDAASDGEYYEKTGYTLQKNLQAYYHGNNLQWTTPRCIEAYKKNKSVVWDSISKAWSREEYHRPIHYIQNNVKHNVKGNTALLVLQNKATICPTCAEVWIKTKFHFHAQLEQMVCPDCQKNNKYLNNKPHTASTIFSGYHSHGNGRWQFYIQRTKQEKWRELPMGLEIECHLRTNNPDERTHAMLNYYKAQKQFNPDWNNFYGEQDGSIGEAGMEIVTNPMSLSFHHQYWDKMLPELRKIAVGWNTAKYNDKSYGIHITMHRNYWSDLNLARLIKFMNDPNNMIFIHALAQRSNIYGKDQKLAGTKLGIKQLTAMENKKLTCSNKYSAVHLKQGLPLIEVRVFSSTLNTNSFFKNLEFLDSFWLWTKATPFNIKYQDYLEWLKNQRKWYQRFSHLLDFLTLDKYPCKGGAVVSEWKHMFPSNFQSQPSLFPFELPISSNESE